MRHAAVPPTLGAARPAVQRFVHDPDWSHVEAMTTRSREGVSPALGAGDKVQRLVALRAFLLVQVWIAPGLLPEDLGDRVRRTREVAVGALGVWHAIDLDLDRPTIPFAPDSRPSVIHAQTFSSKAPIGGAAASAPTGVPSAAPRSDCVFLSLAASVHVVGLCSTPPTRKHATGLRNVRLVARLLRRSGVRGTLPPVGMSRAGRKLKTVAKPEAGRQKGRTYARRHWWVVAPEAGTRLERNCGHRHLLVSDAYDCLRNRPGERVFLVHAEESSV